jgi:hypothetical protein
MGEKTVNPYAVLFHLAARNDPNFLGGKKQDTLLTMEVNRLRWGEVPAPFGDRGSFATGYVMGREGMGRDPSLREGDNCAYDAGYEMGVEVSVTGTRPDWDFHRFTAN